MPEELWIGLIGPLTLRWGEAELKPPTRKSGALLGWLALRDRPAQREELAELLWGPGRLRNLRQELYVLRGLPGAEHWLALEGPWVSLRARVDLHEGRGALRGELLEGLKPPTPAYEDWLEQTRGRWRDALAQDEEEGARRLAQLLAMAGAQVLPVQALASALEVSEERVVGWLEELPLVDGRLREQRRLQTLKRTPPQVRQHLSSRLVGVLEASPLRARLHAELGQDEAAWRDWRALAEQDPVHWEAALAAAPEDRALDTALAAIQSARIRGDQDALEAHHTALEGWAQARQDPDALFEAGRQRALSHLHWRRLEDARALAEELLALADRHRLRPRQAQARLLLAELLRRSGDFEGAAPLFRALATDPGHGARDRVKALNGAGAVAANRGRPEEALAVHREALALARELGDKTLVAQLLNSVGADQGRLGRHEAAARTFQEAAALCLVTGNRLVWAMTRWNAAQSLLMAGLLGEARQELRALSDQALPPSTQAMVLELRCELERACGRLEEAEGWGRRALEAHRALDDARRAQLCALSLESLALQRDPAREPEPFLLGTEALDEGNDRHMAAELLLEAGALVDRRDLAEAALEAYPAPHPLNPRHAFLQALLRARLGDVAPLRAALEPLPGLAEEALGLALLGDPRLADCLRRQGAGLTRAQREARRAWLADYGALTVSV